MYERAIMQAERVNYERGVSTMWEYFTYYLKHTAPLGDVTSINLDDNVQRWLSKVGADGWELVSVSPNVFMGTHQGDILYFKRPKQPEPQQSTM